MRILNNSIMIAVAALIWSCSSNYHLDREKSAMYAEIDREIENVDLYDA